MRRASVLLALGLFAAAPAAAQTSAPAPETPPNPYRELFTRWDGANREALEAEVGTAEPAAPSGPESNAIPAYSPLAPPPRSEAEAVALGRRVGEVVRAGNCAQGERLAREAGDFALVRAVRAHCGGRRR
jgi:hypothetical protein